MNPDICHLYIRAQMLLYNDVTVYSSSICRRPSRSFMANVLRYTNVKKILLLMKLRGRECCGSSRRYHDRSLNTSMPLAGIMTGTGLKHMTFRRVGISLNNLCSLPPHLSSRQRSVGEKLLSKYMLRSCANTTSKEDSQPIGAQEERRNANNQPDTHSGMRYQVDKSPQLVETRQRSKC